jgi:hypothetical protein
MFFNEEPPFVVPDYEPSQREGRGRMNYTALSALYDLRKAGDKGLPLAYFTAATARRTARGGKYERHTVRALQFLVRHKRATKRGQRWYITRYGMSEYGP